MIQVSGLFVYPVKSLPGIKLDQAEVQERGFRHDRRWMIVDKDWVAITQRSHPQLSQLSTSLVKGQIQVSDHHESIILQRELSEQTQEVIIWDDAVKSCLADPLLNEWISDFLGEQCFFAFMPEDGLRPVNRTRSRNQENVSFADGYPYLIIGESSLADLNSRLAEPVPMNRFRPNIVVTGTDAYAEDQWKDLKIGNVSFYGTHPCKRCIVTTIDQKTGIRALEPLKTLANYRKEGNEVVFGLNLIASSSGSIQVGQELILS